MAKPTKDHYLKQAAEEAKTWGVEREPFEPDGAYYRRVASYWKAQVESDPS
jgi:hypothetical protein